MLSTFCWLSCSVLSLSLCLTPVTPFLTLPPMPTCQQAGDVLILTKPLGVGVMTTALKKGLLPPEGYDEVGGL